MKDCGGILIDTTKPRIIFSISWAKEAGEDKPEEWETLEILLIDNALHLNLTGLEE